MSSNPQKASSVWHEGEIDVQQRAGVRAQAEELTSMYRHSAEAGMVGFLAQQRFAVVTTVDHQGRTWASLIAGEPGMLAVPDPTSVRIDAALAETK